MALAVPSFRDFMQNNRAAEEANALVGALALARNEAVTRGVPVSVCSSTDNETCADDQDWTTGWIVFTDVNAPVGRGGWRCGAGHGPPGTPGAAHRFRTRG